MSRIAREGAAFIILCTLLPGCGIQDSINEALAKVDRLITSVEGAQTRIKIESDDWKKESERWRDQLVGVHGAFSKEGLADVATRFQGASESIGSHFSAETRADMDYLEVKIKDNLAAMLRELQGTREKIKGAKNKEDINNAFTSLNKFKVWHDPTIVAFVPSFLAINWENRDKFKAHDTIIKAYGWGFDRPDGELRAKLEVSKKDMKTVRPFENATFSHTTNYLAQIAIDTHPDQLKEDDRFIFLTVGEGPNTRRELPITWDSRPPPPVPPPVPESIISVEVAFYSTDDDKDPEDTVTVSFLANNAQVASWTGSQGERWWDWKGPFPCRWVDPPRGIPFVVGKYPDWFFRGQGNDPAPRTFKLSQDVQPGRAIPGRLIVTKTGTDQGWHFRVELWATTNKGQRLRYDHDWNDKFGGKHQSKTWDFNW